VPVQTYAQASVPVAGSFTAPSMAAGTYAAPTVAAGTTYAAPTGTTFTAQYATYPAAAPTPTYPTTYVTMSPRTAARTEVRPPEVVRGKSPAPPPPVKSPPPVYTAPPQPPAAAAPAPAAPQGPSEHEILEVFHTLDRNQDGHISRAEFIKTLRGNTEVASYFQLPQNVKQEDGSRDKFEAVFQAMDRDGDRTVTYDEIRGYIRNEQPAERHYHAPMAITN